MRKREQKGAFAVRHLPRGGKLAYTRSLLHDSQTTETFFALKRVHIKDDSEGIYV